jgi:hypothetical protein
METEMEVPAFKRPSPWCPVSDKRYGRLPMTLTNQLSRRIIDSFFN